MALKIKYTNETGISLKDAYLKIMYVKCSYAQNDKYNAIISYCIYANEQAKIDDKKPVEENTEVEFYIEKGLFESKSIYEMCYLSLKNKEGFEDATDV